MTDGRIVEGERVLGSGFAVTTHVVVTADHVVRKSEVAALRFRDRRVTRIEHAEDLDVAVLFLDEPVDTAFPITRARPGATWRVTAQPLANDPQLTGTVTDAGRPVVNRGGAETTLLQLLVEEDLGSYKGYSGSAVRSGGGVIGVLVEQVPHRVPRGPASNVVYAVPIQEVLTRFGIRPDADTVPGLAGMGADYAVWIENFLAEYLGKPDQPLIPFGGREAELAALSTWLAGPTPYALVTAEAGRGKSALLTHWAAQVHTSGLADVIFVPISIRFNTASASVALPALATRLAAYHGEALTTTERSAEQWQAEISTYLRRPPDTGKPLLVIVDGLDEATDWEAGAHLFPAAPPAQLKVLASARLVAGDVSGWRNRLNWPSAASVALPPLSPDGVGDVLRAMGNPLAHLVTRVDIVGELHRLSEGDPLLVRLYVESLRNQDVMGLTADDLPSIEKGMRGYYDRWRRELERVWSAGKRRDLQDLFNILACALGPLSRDDLAEINPSGPTGLDLDWLVKDIGRFVIGDGLDQGFVFSHPRFAMFFHEVMGRRERDRWNAAFLDYGRCAIASLREGRAPSYVVRFYGAHLEVADAPSEDLYALLDTAWLNAWHATDGSDAGFLTDCDRAWRRAEQDPDAERAVEVQFVCALARGSVAARSNSVPAQLLVECFKEDMLTPAQALAICRRMSDERNRRDAVVTLAKVLPAHWLDECVSIAASQQREGSRAHAIGGLVARLDGQSLARARAVAENLRQPHAQAVALAAVASRLPPPERSALEAVALAAVKAMDRPRERVRVLPLISRFLSESGLADCVVMAKEVADPVAAVRTLCVLARYQTESQRESTVAAAVAISEQAELAPDAEYRVKFALAEYIPDLRAAAVAELQRFSADDRVSFVRSGRRWIVELPSQLTSDWLVGAAVQMVHRGDIAGVRLVLGLMSPEDRTRTWRRLRELWTSRRDSKYLASLLAIKPPADMVQDAAELAAQAYGLPFRECARALTALALRHTGQSKRDILTAALDAAQTISDVSQRMAAVSNAAKVLAGDEALIIAQRLLITLSAGRPDYVETIPPEIHPDLIDDVLAVYRTEQNLAAQVMMIGRLSERIPEERRAEVRGLALTLASRIERGPELAPHLVLGQLAVAVSGYGDELDHAIIDACETRWDLVDALRYLRNPEVWIRVAVKVQPLPETLPGWLKDEWASALAAELTPFSLPKIIPRLPGSEVESAVQRVLAHEWDARDEELANAVSEAFGNLPPDSHEWLLPIAIGPPGRRRAERVEMLAAQVPEPLVPRLIAVAVELPGTSQLLVYRSLDARCSPDVVRPLADAVVRIDVGTVDMFKLGELANYVPVELQRRIIRYAVANDWLTYLLTSAQAEDWRWALSSAVLDEVAAAPQDSGASLLAKLWPLFPEDQWERAIRLAVPAPRLTDRFDVLAMLLTYRPNDHQLWARLTDEIGESDPDTRDRLLRLLLGGAADLADEGLRLTRSLIDHMSPSLLPHRLFLLARETDDNHLMRQAWMATGEPAAARDWEQAVTDIGPEVAGRCPDLVADVLRDIARIRTEDLRAQALFGFAAQFPEWSPDQAVWNSALRTLSAYPRPALVTNLSALAQVGTPSGLTPAQTANALVLAVQRVGEWWD